MRTLVGFVVVTGALAATGCGMCGLPSIISHDQPDYASVFEKGTPEEIARIARCRSTQLYHGYGEMTLLHLAAYHGRTEAVRILLKRKARLESRDGCKMTPLHHAAERGHVEAARLLLDAGARVNTTDACGKTPLQYAADEGHSEMVTLLVARGGRVPARGGK